MLKKDIKKLDKAWSELIRKRGKCECCNSSTSLNSHHIVGRRNYTLRWDIRNGVCLCAGCHMFKPNSFHRDPIWATDWLRDNRPEDLEYLKEKKDKVIKQNYEDVKKLLEDTCEKK